MYKNHLKNFGGEIYSSWLEKLTLEKEYNDYLILGVPTRFLGLDSFQIFRQDFSSNKKL